MKISKAQIQYNNNNNKHKISNSHLKIINKNNKFPNNR
jgi:hypothetical protein